MARAGLADCTIGAPHKKVHACAARVSFVRFVRATTAQSTLMMTAEGLTRGSAPPHFCDDFVDDHIALYDEGELIRVSVAGVDKREREKSRTDRARSSSVDRSRIGAGTRWSWAHKVCRSTELECPITCFATALARSNKYHFFAAPHTTTSCNQMAVTIH